MRSLPVKIMASIIGGAVLLGLWVFFAPMKLGGSTTYSVTSGISMEPLLHKNDLALVRTESSYHVGDVVLYQSPVLHRPVLHRILLIQHGNYFFKGDNNGFVDPGYATRSELVGKLWFNLPEVGAVLSWFGIPSHAALLAGLAAMVIVLTSVGTTKSRRRRRRGSPKMIPQQQHPEAPNTPSGAGSPAARAAPDPTRARKPVPFLEGPTSTLVSFAVVLSLAVLLLGMGFSRPEHRLGARPGAYEQAGTFSYSAAANAPNDVYPSGGVKTGDPIYSSLVDTVTLRFGYQFTSRLPHHIEGTVELRALVLSKTDTWQELSTVVPITKFSGDKTSISSALPLASLYRLIGSVSAQSGVTGTNYSVDVQPVVHITGTAGNRSIDQKFSPVLPFAVTQSSIRVDVAVAPPPPGATYAPSSATAALDAALHPSQAGSIPHVVDNDITIAKYQVPVPAVRFLGIALAVLALILAVVHDRRRRRGTKRSDEELIAGRFHALIVPVASLGPSQGLTPIAVPDFAHLAGLASFLERPILYEVRKGNRTFAVDDDTRRYVTLAVDRRQGRARSDSAPTDTHTGSAPSNGNPTPTDSDPAAPDCDPTAGATRAHRRQVASSSPSGRRPRRALLVRGGAGLVALAVVTTLTLSLTATTTVPASRVGRSVQARQIAQLSPAGCSSLGLTSLVRGSGTFSNSASHALVIGSAGVDTITSSGQYNCFVGGAGKDRITAAPSDVCIIGPTIGTSYYWCTKKAT